MVNGDDDDKRGTQIIMACVYFIQDFSWDQTLLVDQRNGSIHKFNATNHPANVCNVRNNGRQSIGPCDVQCCTAILCHQIDVPPVGRAALPFEQALQIFHLEYLCICVGTDFNITNVLCLPLFPSMHHWHRFRHHD